MIIKCDHCGQDHNRKPSKISELNYCSPLCRSNAKHIEGTCAQCGVKVRKLRCAQKDYKIMLCGAACFKRWTSERFTKMNTELNPTRMVFTTKLKLREHHLDSGEGKSYAKTFSRHTHRIVAEKMLGRKLLPGEVVHHKDENKRNNHPDNLQVFPSQAEHARHHALLSKLGKRCQE